MSSKQSDAPMTTNETNAEVDPIFAALNALRLAKAERAVATDAVDWKTPINESRTIEWKRYENAIDGHFKARRAVCAVMPTTTAGAAALVRFLAGEMIFEEVEFGYHGAEEATRQALSNLDDILTRLAALADLTPLGAKSRS